jgi:serine/threonine-protein kinase/endoribonuclease IRE1
MVLSDFGLAKRLDQGQSSYLQTGNHPVGTTGWLAPECLTGEVDLDQGFDGSSSRHSRYTDDDGPKRFDAQKPKHGRLTRAVDLFALGCVYYYVITSGGHPYGGRYDRDRNIIRDEKDLSALDSYGEDGFEAKVLITKLLSPEAKQRYVTCRTLLAEPTTDD